MTQRRAIALIDDDALVRSSMTSLLRSFGLSVRAFDSAIAFLELDPLQWDCLISDVHMPQMSGLDLARRLFESHPSLPIILITAFPDAGVHEQAGGTRRVLEKPCAPEAIQEALETFLGPL